jgi:rhodanese-related sulfurtransferase
MLINSLTINLFQMKKFFIYSIMVAFIATMTFTSCKDTTEKIDEFQILSDYLQASSLDINTITTGFVMAAPTDGNVSTKWVMDIRSATDFTAAHITGAHNVAFADILTAGAAADKSILVVCYTGQTACYAASLLRLYGHPDAQALKWGMSGWNATFDKWTANCKDLTTASNWTTTATTAQTFDAPTLSTGLADGAEILKKRVEEVVSAGFKSISGADVLANPVNYYVNNYFSQAHYDGFGHVAGAVRINPILLSDGSIFNMDPSKEIVTYCYTGQTSAVVTAYLNVLGYNAKSLLFGMNGVSKSNAFWTSGNVTNHWGFDSNPKSLSTVQ